MKANEVLELVLSVDGHERESCLQKLCGDDSSLMLQVKKMLAENHASDDKLDGLAPNSKAMGNRSLGDHSDARNKQDETNENPSVGTVHNSIKQDSTSLTAGMLVGPYKLRDRLGQGGMGDVWIADQSLPIKRRVALKVIRRGIGSLDILARFDAERQALALMNHPNIARILDAGTTPDGQPYFAMELVTGKPLTTYCDENRLGINDRLSLFADVCDGVQHAHQKGIIHRDLKPSNIIVGMMDGKAVAKVIDFGLAKALESTQRLTDQSLFTGIGQILGTLKYMSPEQANLSSADVDTRTDIYALGVILYELLTGSTPLDESSIKGQAALKVLEFVREKEPVKPSSRLGSSTDEQRSSITNQRRTDSVRLNRVLAGDLDWIVMKALEKDRTRRYESASGFGADVQRYLKNEPIVARPPSLNYRMKKFVRKNRAGVIAAGLLGISLLVGLFGTAYGFYRARQSAIAERIAKLDAQDREEEAVQQRTRAETREQEAIDAVKRFGEVIRNNPELKNNPSLGSLRKSLLREPLAFFQSLRERLESDNETRPEALARLASVAYELGTLTDQIGEKENALLAFKQALAIREQLVQVSPADTVFRRDLASSHASLAALFRQTGKSTEAIDAVQQSLKILHRLAIKNPSDRSLQIELASSHNINGVLLDSTGKANEALKSFYEALKIQNRLARENPSETNFQRELAGSHSNIGLSLANTGQRVQALKEYEAGLEIRKQLVRGNPSKHEYESDLATSYNNIGVFLKEIGRTKEALKHYRLALGIQKKLALENPSVTKFHQALTQSHYNIGVILSETGKSTEALRSFQQLREVQQQLVRENPTATNIQAELARCHTNIGSLLTSMGRPTEAMEAFNLGLRIQDRLVRENPTVTRFQNELARSHDGIGLLLRDAGKTTEARQSFQHALEIRERLAQQNPNVTEFQNALAASHNWIGLLQRISGKKADSIQAFERALKIQEQLAQDNPTVIDFQTTLGVTYINIGSLLLETGKSSEARKAFNQALEIQERLSRDNPTSTKFQSQIGATLHNLAAIEIDEGEFAAASERLRKAVGLQQKVLATNPADPSCRQYLRMHLTTLSKVAVGLQDSGLALEARQGLVKLTISDPFNSKLNERLAIFEKDSAGFNANELLALGQFAYDTMRFSLATRLFDQALNSQDTLFEDRQKQIAYNAACCAALAAAGKGNEEPPLNETAKAKLRGQAMSWLQAELDRWEKFPVEKPEQKALVRQTLLHWQNDADLESIRDPKQLAKLPETERNQWENLWKRVKDKIQNDRNPDQ